MSEPVYFVVEHRAGRETPSIIVDQLPPDVKRSAVYKLRLDRLPDAERWLKMTTAELYRTYCYMRDHKMLPAENLAGEARPKAEPRTRQLGEYWEPPARPWPDRPADPLGAGGELFVDGKLVPR